MRWAPLAVCALVALASLPGVRAAAPTCGGTTAPLNMAGHTTSRLENDGTDYVTVYWNVTSSAVTLENDVATASVQFAGNNVTNYLAKTYTVTSTDRSTATEPASVDGSIVAWNAVASDGTMNFKFKHKFTSADNAGTTWQATGSGTTTLSGSVTCTASSTFQLYNYGVAQLNQGNGAGAYDSTGTWTASQVWSGWAVAPTSSADSTNFIRFDNAGTQSTTATIAVNAISCSTQSCARTGSLASTDLVFKYGTASSPAGVGSWTTATPSSGTATVTVVTGSTPTWIKYTVTPPQGSPKSATDGYTGTFTVTYSP